MYNLHDDGNSRSWLRSRSIEKTGVWAWAEPLPPVLTGFAVLEPYCERCFGPCRRRPRHGEFNI